METLVIHDLEGVVISSMSGTVELREPVGVPFLRVEVPEGKRISSVDVSVTPHQVILEDIPPNEIEKINDKLDNAILELTTLIAMGGM